MGLRFGKDIVFHPLLMKKAIFDTSSYRDSTMVSYLAKKLGGEEESENGGNMATWQARKKDFRVFQVDAAPSSGPCPGRSMGR